MTETLDVDGFGIDIEALFAALCHSKSAVRHTAAYSIAHIVKLNLTQDDKKRFKEYQEQNDPCKESK